MVKQKAQINHFKQSAIAFDQWLNATFFAGYADETLSARCWRERKTSKFWRGLRLVVDLLFIAQARHCYQAYLSEVDRKQLPPEYRI